MSFIVRDCRDQNNQVVFKASKLLPIKELRLVMEKELGMALEYQRLLFKGKFLDDKSDKNEATPCLTTVLQAVLSSS